MLLSKEISELAADLKEESRSRSYVRALMPEVVEDDSFWRMLVETFEIVRLRSVATQAPSWLLDTQTRRVLHHHERRERGDRNAACGWPATHV
jgi:hypothetical protein